MIRPSSSGGRSHTDVGRFSHCSVVVKMQGVNLDREVRVHYLVLESLDSLSTLG